MKTRAPEPPATSAPEPEPVDDDAGLSIQVSGRKLALLGVLVVASLGLLYVLVPQIAGLDDTWRRLEDGSPWWLGLGAVLTVGMFTGYVFTFRTVYREAKLSRRDAWTICMAALAASRLLAAGGAGGLVLQAWALRRRGLEPRRVADRTVSFIVLQYVIYTLSVVVFGYALHFGLLPGNAPWVITWLPATIALVVTALGLSLGFVPPNLQRRMFDWAGRGGGSRGRRLVAKAAVLPTSAGVGVRDAMRHVRAGDRAVLGAVVFWAAQLGTLAACFHAFGDVPPLAVLVVAFFVGMLGNLLPLPGGIGGVDGGMFGAFAAFGVDLGTAAVAILAYRALTFWLPTLPGAFAYLRLRKTVERWRAGRVGIDSYT